MHKGLFSVGGGGGGRGEASCAPFNRMPETGYHRQTDEDKCCDIYLVYSVEKKEKHADDVRSTRNSKALLFLRKFV